MTRKRRTRRLRRKSKAIMKHGRSAAPTHKLRSGRTGIAHSKKTSRRHLAQRPGADGQGVGEMSAAYPKCESEVCVFDVLVPFFGDHAYDVAMNATCFPASCKVAAEQARQIVITAKAWMIYGMKLEDTVSAACADADAEMEAAMQEYTRTRTASTKGGAK